MLQRLWQGPQAAPPTKMRLEEFIGWFEQRIVEIFSGEMKGLQIAMLTVDECIGTLKTISDNARKLSLSSTAPLNNRAMKILDQLDSIPEIFAGGRRFYIHQNQFSFLSTSQLPDLFFVCDFVLNVKNKLKAIDDVVSSKKIDHIKSKSIAGSNRKTLDPLRIRMEIKRTASALDHLEAAAVEKLLVMNHFSDLKANIHKPVDEMIVAFSCLPSMTDYKAVVDIEFEELKKCEDRYTKERSASCLAAAAKLKNESLFIEICVTEMLQVLLPVTHEAASDIIIPYMSKSKEDASWFGSLTTLLTADVGQLMLGCVSGIESNFATCMSYLQVVCGRGDAEAKKMLQKVNQIAPELVQNILDFDLDLFNAYLDDWNERRSQLDTIMSTEEFASHYQAFDSARTILRQKRDQYDQHSSQFNDVIEKHRIVNFQFDMLKDKLTEITLAEFNAVIEFATTS